MTGGVRPRLFLVMVMLVLAGAMLAACSNRAIYESLQQAERQACERQPIALIEACMESTRMSYEEYRRELEQLSPQRNSPGRP